MPSPSPEIALPKEIRRDREQRLRSALPSTIEFLQRRRADLIDPAVIDDFVAINWMEWHGGSLRLTVTGRNICAQIGLRPAR
ncbi:MAG: hypothetical protein RLZZ592_2825 [Pseudomonadota bacterium]|jgi:hypothetical protein